VHIPKLLTALLTTFIGKGTEHERRYMDFKIIDITNCKTCKKKLLDVECVIVIRYYNPAAKARA